MTALGAKPNHGFFNCQHPATGNSRARMRGPRRARPATRARACRHGCARRAQACVPSNQNIFFSAVSCFTRETSARRRRLRRRRCGHPGTRWNGGERQPSFFSSSGRFSASHNPDCAKLRSPLGIERRRSTHVGATTTRIFGRRIGCGRRHPRGAMRALDASDRRHADTTQPTVSATASATTSTMIGAPRRHRRPTNGRRRDARGLRKRRSRPRSRGRLPDVPGLARCGDALSARRLRAARRSRQDRAGR